MPRRRVVLQVAVRSPLRNLVLPARRHARLLPARWPAAAKGRVRDRRAFPALRGIDRGNRYAVSYA